MVTSTRPERSLGCSSRCENTCTHTVTWRARALRFELVCVYATGAVWDVACGCYLFKACVMRHAVLCRSTRCVVNRQSSRPVCRESCFDLRLRTPRRCVWPPSRAWSRRSGKVNGKRPAPRARRRRRAPGRGRGAGARRGRRDDGLSDGLPVALVVVPACRRPAAVISD